MKAEELFEKLGYKKPPKILNTKKEWNPQISEIPPKI